jgi:hypothetical protein
MAVFAAAVSGSDAAPDVSEEAVRAFLEMPEEDEVNRELTLDEVVQLTVPEVQAHLQAQQQQQEQAAADTADADDPPAEVVTLQQAEECAHKLLVFADNNTRHFTAKQLEAVRMLKASMECVVPGAGT